MGRSRKNKLLWVWFRILMVTFGNGAMYIDQYMWHMLMGKAGRETLQLLPTKWPVWKLMDID